MLWPVDLGLKVKRPVSVFPERPGWRAALDRDAAAAHPQMDAMRRSLSGVNGVTTQQEAAVRLARKIGGNAAESGARVDRVWTRVRQHHYHVARMTVHLNVSSNVAHPYIAVVMVNYQPRVAW